MNPRELLLDAYGAALAACDPLKVVRHHLPAPPHGRTLVVGAGKAAASMAAAVEQAWPAGSPLDGLVVTRYGHALPTRCIEVMEAAHPVPDDAGTRASARMLAAVESLGEDDLLLALISGGGSSLLSLPVDAVPMEDLRRVTRELLRCGAPIQEINAVRKHLSRIQGGRLAAASRARVCALVISDVTGDDPTHIASGPCTADTTTYGDALGILRRYSVTAPETVQSWLERGARGEIPETPKPGDPLLARVTNTVIATSHDALVSASMLLAERGIKPVILGDSVCGEAREVARVYAALVREIRHHSGPWPAPVALLSGGETTVTVRGRGRGGRNCEFLLALAIALDGMPGVHAIACDTDGIDGSEDNAGAVVAPDTLSRACASGLHAQRMLDDNDAYTFFRSVDNLVTTGPTLTNVNDFRALLIL